MQIIAQTSDKLTLRLTAPTSLMNALRRSVAEIPVLAIDEVEIFKNDSALYDEVLAHRIGLIPFKNEEPVNEKTEYEIKLSKVGPCTVVAGDFKGPIAPVHAQIPLVLLEKDQEVEVVATVRAGKGVTHEKYTPGTCYYRHLSIVTSKNAAVQKLVENARGAVKAEKVKDGWLCDLPEATLEEVERLDAEAIKDSEESILIIESFGQMSAKDVLLKAIRSLGDNLEAFEKALK